MYFLAIKTICTCTLLFFINSAVSAQSVQPEAQERTVLSSEAPTLRFENLNLEDGLAQFTAEDVMQDSYGYIWIATQGGLHRYNGYEFDIYTNSPFDSTSISSNYIYALEEASNGDLWIGTVSSGLNRFDRKTQTFTHYEHDPNDSTTIAANDIFDVYEAKNGDLWAASQSEGLSRLPAGETDQFIRYQHDPENSNSLTVDLLHNITEDEDGNIWVSSRRGINRIDPETNLVTRYLDKDGPEYIINSQYNPPGNPETLWLASENGLIKLHPETGEHTRFVPSDSLMEGQQSFRLSDVTPDPNDPNILWAVGINTGVARFDTRTQQYTIYRNDERDPNSIISNTAFNITGDRSGNLWIGHQTDGVSQFTPSSANFLHIRHDPQNPESIGPDGVWKIYAGRNQTLWAGTGYSDTFYLNRVDLTSGRVTRYRADPDDPQTVTPQRILAITEDSNGRIWSGANQGLSSLNPATGEIKRYLIEPVEENLRDNFYFSAIPSVEHEDHIWAGSYTGLKLVDAQAETISSVPIETDEVVDPVITDLFYDSNNRLWAATFSGLLRVDTDGENHRLYRHDLSDTTSIASNQIVSIAQRENEPNILWLATWGGGINRFDISTGKSTHYLTDDGLVNNTIYGILVDDQNTLWMSTNQGISNFIPDDESFKNYGLEDGLIQLEYTQNGYAKDSDGVLYFGHKDGITAFHPENLNVNTTPPQVVISDFKLFNESVIPGPDAPFDDQIELEDEILVNFDQSEITIEYAGLHYSNPAKNQYRYQLEGFDDNWVDAGTRRTATYTNLSPGEYTFTVQASNADRVWNKEGASVQLMVLPPWYRTWWAFGLYALVVAAGIFGIDRIQRKRLLRIEREKAREKELEQAKEIEKAYNDLEKAHEELKAAQTQLVQQEKLASLGQLTAGIAHEIKNPLNFVNNFSELSVELVEEAREEVLSEKEKFKSEKESPFEEGAERSERGDDTISEVDETSSLLLDILNDIETNLKTIHKHGARADSIVKSMLQHSRGGDGTMESSPLNPLIKEYVNLAFHGMRAGKHPINVDIDLQLGEEIGEVPLIAEDFTRVVLNLVNNAFDAMRDKLSAASGQTSDYQPKLTVRTKKSDETIIIEIEDNGPGIPEEMKDKILQPFFTTKKGTDGTGLGLSITHDIVKAHGGNMIVTSQPGKSIFTIQLNT